MNGKSISIKMREGEASGRFYAPPSGRGPGVIIYMDAFGIREALGTMAERMAGWGYGVLLPNLYYRAGEVGVFDPKKAFTDPAERDRITPLYKSLTHELLAEDTASYLDFLAAEPATSGRKVGTVGYCMGGGFALSAAGRNPQRVAAAASFHGARLATDQPDSPHLLAPKMRAEIYVGVAGIDQHFTEEERGRVLGALEACAVRHKVEVYEGAKHGFAISDTLAFDHDAAERHFAAVKDLFDRNLG